MSGFIEFKVAARSRSVSPLDCELLLNGKFTTLAPSKVPAISKLTCVLVEFSKKRFI